MNSGLYIVAATCPICEKSFNVIKVRTTAIKVERVDEDFCIHYEGINPSLYEPWICEHCGYAGFGSSYTELSQLEIIELQKLCLMKFIPDTVINPFELTDFHKQVYKYFDSLRSDGERDNKTALEAYNILLLNLNARKVSSSVKAKAMMRMGWICRSMEDPAEMEYLKEAADLFAKTYQEEALPIGKFDSATCAYLTGELYRRTGNVKEAMDWLGRVLRLPPSPETSKIVDKAREQIQAIKSS